MYAGTPASNAADKVRRGRARTLAQPGERNGRAKLTVSDVERLRALRSAGWTQAALSEEFGISTSQVSRIVRREEWA